MFKKDFWITFVMAFLLSWLILQLPFFQPATTNEAPAAQTGALLVEASKPSYAIGDPVSIVIRAQSGTLLAEFPHQYPKPPFVVSKNGTPVEATTSYVWNPPAIVAKPDTPAVVSFEPWTTTLFQTPGTYTVSVPYMGSSYNATIEISGDNMLSWIWTTLFIKPLYNLLLLCSYLAGNSLFWGIIIVTLVLRLILLVPSQRAMESQRAMQLIQPKLKEIQTKHKGDQQRISIETVELMKKHKVNPFGGCLPILLQIPILIAIFTVIQHGLSLAFTLHIYAPLSWINVQSISSVAFGILDLAKPEYFVLPLIVGVLQYIQMDLSMKKAKDSKVITVKDPNMPDPEMMQKTMKYVLPVLIWIMAITLPSGVGIYWAISTLFSIGQQIFVNQEPLTL